MALPPIVLESSARPSSSSLTTGSANRGLRREEQGVSVLRAVEKPLEAMKEVRFRRPRVRQDTDLVGVNAVEARQHEVASGTLLMRPRRSRAFL
jgi:hypothetical protein